MEAQQAVRRAHALYLTLQRAGFTRSTFLELGEAADVARPFGALSSALKVTLFKLVDSYETRLLDLMAEERAIAEAFASDVEVVDEKAIADGPNPVDETMQADGEEEPERQEPSDEEPERLDPADDVPTQLKAEISTEIATPVAAPVAAPG